MSTVLEYPATELGETDYHAFNEAVWENLVDDPALAALDFRIETNRHGQIVMMPPPGFQRSRLQSQTISHLMRLTDPGGQVLAECPVSSSGGVKGVDVVWVSDDRSKEVRRNVLTIAPEICVEILSPGNTRAEIEEKRRLYFEAGAEEVWIVSAEGEVAFFGQDRELENSALCPAFPSRIDG